MEIKEGEGVIYFNSPHTLLNLKYLWVNTQAKNADVQKLWT